ncbi:MAG: GNAT family protein [Phycisphaerales bacterium]
MSTPSSHSVAWVRPVELADAAIAREIRLEPLLPSHAGDLFAVADPELFTHGSQAPREWSVRGFEEEIDKVRSLAGVVAFAIIAQRGESAGRAIGRTTFMDIRAEHRALEIGRTWIGRAHHGTRVNPECKYLLLRHAFESLSPGAIRVQITTNAMNLHSQHAIEKLGAVREGTLRRARILAPSLDRSEPAVRDWIYYSILDDEWAGVKARLERRLDAMS